MQPSFNLIDQPWIGAIDHEGHLQEYSLRDLLLRAHELRGLHDDSTLVIASQLRMILALLHRIYDGPRDQSEWQAIWQVGRFDTERIDRYFAQWYDRFDLFSSQHPFYQTTEEVGNLNPVTTLIPEAASGNNATLFDHQTEDDFLRFPPNRAASAVLVAQYFSLGGGQSGIKGRNFTDGTLTRGALFFVEGKHLFQTLLFSLVPYEFNRMVDVLGGDGIPAWEQSDPMQPDRSLPDGLLDYMTWQSRRIKLIPDSDLGVTKVYRSQGLILDREANLLDPAKFYKRYSDTLGAITLQTDKAVWRDSEALFRLRDDAFRPPAAIEWLGWLVDCKFLPETATLQYLVLGMASGQAKVDYYRSEFMPLPLDYLTDNSDAIDKLSLSLRSAERVASSLARSLFLTAWLLLVPDIEQEAPISDERIASKLSMALKELRTELKENTRDEEAKKIASLYLSWGAERRYWALLEPLFRQTMQAIPQDSSAAIRDWFAWLRRCAWDVFDQVCNGLGDDPRALKAIVRGREQLVRGLGTVLRIQE
jgi:CRISPR system Cascade subunit CasA